MTYKITISFVFNIPFCNASNSNQIENKSGWNSKLKSQIKDKISLMKVGSKNLKLLSGLPFPQNRTA